MVENLRCIVKFFSAKPRKKFEILKKFSILRSMKVSIGMDHGGYVLRDAILSYLRSHQYEILDHGTNSEQSVDYPDYAVLVASDVQSHRADYGILVCRSGEGMMMTANRFAGIYAALVWNVESTTLSCGHNHANVLCLGSNWVKPEEIPAILDAFFQTQRLGERHQRRIMKIDALGGIQCPR